MDEHHHKTLEARVVTTSGIFPHSGFKNVPEHEHVQVLLKEADKHLRITDTAGWIAVVAGRKIDIARSFTENGLHGRIEIDWGPDHGAGGHA